MLQQMGIRNFALIESMNIDFEKGITVITGETGAGKSILIDALSILLGERASAEYIRHGKDKFVIHAVFSIEDNEPLLQVLEEKNIVVEDGQLFISRSFSEAGKTQILINDQPIPLKVLRDIGNYLADIHGQYSNQALLDKAIHHQFLDGFSAEGQEAFASYTKAYREFKNAEKALAKLDEDEAQRAREIDTLEYQINEIISAQIDCTEDNKIPEELQRFDNYEKLYGVTQGAYSAISTGRHPMIDVLNQIRIEIHDLVRLDGTLQETDELLQSIYFQMEEASHSLYNYMQSMSYNEARADYCRQRDSLLYGLKKKYGESLEDVLAFADTAQERLDSLVAVQEERPLVEARLEKAKDEAQKALVILRKIRSKNAALMMEQIHSHLADLGMEKAQIQFQIDESETLTPLGAESIELVFAPNQGEGFKPLAKIASGGELSRVALAFSSVVKKGNRRVLVFDEIDVGISGEVAIKVAEKIKNLSMAEQVLCITHMPQTVAVADQHFHLSKKEVNGRTESSMTVLDKEEHMKHMAMMISGNTITPHAMETVRELESRFHQK